MNLVCKGLGTMVGNRGSAARRARYQRNDERAGARAAFGALHHREAHSHTEEARNGHDQRRYGSSNRKAGGLGYCS